MYDPEQSSLSLFWWIQEIIPHIEIGRTLHKKGMILTRVVFNYFDEFKKLSHTLKFMAHYIRDEYSLSEFSSAILMNSRNSLTHWDS